MTTANVKLDPQRRGTEFKYISTLKDGWTAPMFTGGILFTIRRVIPGSEVPDDSDPDVLAQVSVAGGGIVFDSDPTAEWLETEAKIAAFRNRWDLRA